MATGRDALPLRAGDKGEAVRDLQQRLIALGYAIDADEAAVFGPSTSVAVEDFQRKRALDPSGVVDVHTWEALAEAGYRLGDRLLFDARPMLRGDDVADLQQRLGALGFDAGRVDGIFGELTARALSDFQRNAGQVVDGICGPATLAALDRLGPRDGQLVEPIPVTEVREREALRRAPRTLVGRIVALGHTGGLDDLVGTVARAVSTRGATGAPLMETDGDAQAEAANLLAADVYVEFELGAEGVASSYWMQPSGTGSSPGGRHLATLLQDGLVGALGAVDLGIHGRSYPILRRTRMPAVVCQLGPARLVSDQLKVIGRATADALERWASTPC